VAKTPRKWQGARTPSGLKRVRSAERRHAILQPRRTAAKTLVKNALALAAGPTDGQDPQAALATAISALDRAAKVGAIHPNAAARRKSRLASKVAATLGGTTVQAGARTVKTTGTAAAAKAAKARIAAGKAAKAKGAQTAAGKARAALTRTARTTDTTESAAPAATTETTPAPRTRARASGTAAAKTTGTKSPASKSTATKATGTTAAKPTATRTRKPPAS